ncbi:circularly permuted type 2 ATP-grasp protein [Roseospira goensis]|uniref:Putative circularly permuted ATP-grasp superfamily protein/putative alpha-E superfamily protein n=1 Tax=Roseospira goensis TaxID=391922 RepID=A0A7W6S0P1_9PROT|nr:circularly permuted type 2 ATP-grasp protein [Roseospira goensis]MBB4286744.1 putative circularly permuted ATP-grasp superfamily protein/putative alpha-E superfamily protein [Roseospira goensis]
MVTPLNTSANAEAEAGAGAETPAVPGSSWLCYESRPGVYDEMVAADGTVRPHWRDLVAHLDALGAGEIGRRADRARRLIRDNGVTYNVYGDPAGQDRAWSLDPVPLLIDEADWLSIERAMVQRAQLLNAVLADLYGPRHLLSEGILPAALVHANPAYLRPLVGARPSGGVFVHLLAVDLARAPDGRWWVVDTRSEMPSGIGYALENRVIMNRVLPDVLRALPVHRLAQHLTEVRDSLIRRAPPTREHPRVVLWTPGPFNETYFEHVYLARYMGFTLVEGEDLTVRDGRVFLKTLEGLQPVDVILRRNESSFCDPLELKGESTLGAPGLVEAAHERTVSLANALGAGLAESPGLMPFLPSLCHRLLGEELLMPSVATWWCGQPRERGYVLDQMPDLAVRSAFHATGPISRGALMDPASRAALRRDIEHRPYAWVGQEAVSPSTAPVWTDGRLEPRPLVLRVHVCAHDGGYSVMPGGLARVSGAADDESVSMQRGGGSKDAWVLSERPVGLPPRPRPGEQVPTVVRGVRDLPSRVADDLFWLGRYVERCDNTARLLRCLIGRLAETGAGSGEVAVILGMLWPMGHPPFTSPAGAGAAEHDRTVRAILDANMDPSNPRGLAALALNVHRVGVRVRDRLSIDTWRAINALIDALGLGAYTSAVPSEPGVPQTPAPGAPPPLTLEDAGPRLSAVLMPVQVITGLANENMTRGLGWRFLDTGRRIERALHMLALFEGVARTDSAAREAALEAALEVADSQMTYRARYLEAPQTVPVLDVLLADESNPRSLAYQLVRLGLHMDSLAPDQAFGLRSHEQRLTVRLLGITRTVDLNRLPVDGGGSAPAPASAEAGDEPDAAMPPPADLPTLLRLLRGLLNALSESLARQYFAHAVETRHGSAGGRVRPARDHPESGA